MGANHTTKTTNNQTQTSTPTGNPYTKAALNQVQGVGQIPYTAVTQGVAPLNAEQLSAENNINTAYGQVSPYYAQAANLFNEGTQPLTADQINNYYNPMAANVTAQMQNIFGQQDVQANLGANNAAGGIGGDRASITMGNLANQQGLAAGQTYAGLWQNAMQAAQAQQQTELAGGQGFGNLANSQLQALMNTAGQEFQMGTVGQQTTQQGLNAAYNQQMQALAYPYQQAQFVASNTYPGASIMGGNTVGVGTGTYTPPAPSPISQAAGIGIAGLSAFAKEGGRIKGYAMGGSPFQAPIPNTRQADMLAMQHVAQPMGMASAIPQNIQNPAMNGQWGQNGRNIKGYDVGGAPTTGVGPYSISGLPYGASGGYVPTSQISQAGSSPSLPGGMSPMSDPMLQQGMMLNNPNYQNSMFSGMGGMGSNLSQYGKAGTGLGTLFTDATGYSPTGAFDELAGIQPNIQDSGWVTTVTGAKRGGEIKGYDDGGGTDDVPQDINPYTMLLEDTPKLTDSLTPDKFQDRLTPDVAPPMPPGMDLASNQPYKWQAQPNTVGMPNDYDTKNDTQPPPGNGKLAIDASDPSQRTLVDSSTVPPPQGGYARAETPAGGGPTPTPFQRVLGGIFGGSKTGPDPTQGMTPQERILYNLSQPYRPTIFGHPYNPGMLAAGLGMMAGTSPFPLTNIGTGGMEGMNYARQLQQMNIEQQARAMQSYMESQRLGIEKENLNRSRYEYRDTPMGQEKIDKKGIEQTVITPYSQIHVQGQSAAGTVPQQQQAVVQPWTTDHPGARTTPTMADVAPETPNAGNMTERGVATNANIAAKDIENWEKMGNAARQNNAQILQARADLSRMDEGGILQPGTTFAERLNMTKHLNLLGSLLGWGQAVKPEDIGTAEDLRKLTNQMGANFVNAHYGGSRESAFVVNTGIQTVPGGDITKRGDYNIMGHLYAANKMAADQQEWTNNYKDLTGRTQGADVAFFKANPVQQYNDMAERISKAWYAIDSEHADPKAVGQLLLKHGINPSDVGIQ